MNQINHSMNIAKYSIRKSVIAWGVTVILLGAGFFSLAGLASLAKEMDDKQLY